MVDFDDPLFAGLGPGAVRYVQFRYDDPKVADGAYNWTDTLELKLCP